MIRAMRDYSCTQRPLANGDEMRVWTERKYLVGDSDMDEGEFLTICPAPDYPDDGVLIATFGEKSECAFGKIHLQLSTDFMRAIGEAIIKCCDDVEQGRQK